MTTVGRQNAYEEILSLRKTWQDRLAIEEAERQACARAEEARRAEEQKVREARRAEEVKREAEEDEEKFFRHRVFQYEKERRLILERFANSYFGTDAAFRDLSPFQKEAFAKICEAHCRRMIWSFGLLGFIVTVADAWNFLFYHKWLCRIEKTPHCQKILQEGKHPEQWDCKFCRGRRY